MRVLVACEFSGIVRDAFLARGHDAWSCDLLDTERPGPHIKGDVLDHLDDGWDLMIAHPPCTFLSNAGAVWLWRGGLLNRDRYEKGVIAAEFFTKLLKASISHIAVENPTPSRIFRLPEASQVIQPHQFGHPYSKRTLLWLRNLPLLAATGNVESFQPYVDSTSSRRRGRKGMVRNTKQRSRTFQGIADAMADQWGRHVSNLPSSSKDHADGGAASTRPGVPDGA